jgi:hypothetical protein
MLGFGADGWLNNTAFRAKSNAEFLKYETAWLFFLCEAVRPFFSCGGAGVRDIVVVA